MLNSSVVPLSFCGRFNSPHSEFFCAAVYEESVATNWLNKKSRCYQVLPFVIDHKLGLREIVYSTDVDQVQSQV